MNRTTKLSSIGIALAASGVLATAASCADSDPGPGPEPEDPRTVLDGGPADSAPSDADCDGGADQCSSTAIDCSEAAFCPVATGADPRHALTSVWGSGKTDVWMVGTQGTILHWDGASFTPAPSGTKDVLFAVRGTGPTDVWAVGSRANVFHFAGGAAKWEEAPEVAPMYAPYTQPANENLLHAIWARPGGEVWVAGEPYPVVPEGAKTPTNMNLWRRAGSGGDAAWTPSVVASAFTVRGLWASGPGDVWAVGGTAGTSTTRYGRTLHTTGNAGDAAPVWTEVDSQSAKDLNAVWGAGPNDVWAVGNGGTIRHWTGATPKRWQIVDAPTAHDLNAVWGTGPNDVWVVGDHGTVLHFDGTRWTQPVAAFPAGLEPHLRGVWASAPDDVWIVGDSIVLHSTGKLGQP